MSLKSLIMMAGNNFYTKESLMSCLEERGFEIVSASFMDTIKQLVIATPDAILLDLALPVNEGLKLLRNIREYTDAPVIILCEKATPADKIMYLEAGADSYIAKPFHTDVLVAKIRAQLRRYQPSTPPPAPDERKKDAVKIQFGRWILDRNRFQAFDEQGRSAELTAKEFFLLETLVLTPESVLTREKILDHCRADDYETSDRAVDVQIMRIRKKLGDRPECPQFIKAVRGIGYGLVPKTEILA